MVDAGLGISFATDDAKPSHHFAQEIPSPAILLAGMRNGITRFEASPRHVKLEGENPSPSGSPPSKFRNGVSARLKPEVNIHSADANSYESGPESIVPAFP
jgi:hypothetical protein